MRASILIFIGSGLGGVVRHLLNDWITRISATPLPVGILLINISGSLAMDLLAGWFAFKGAAPQDVRLFLTTGVISGYTTFSAFSLDAVLLAERGEVASATAYVAVSVVLSIAAVMAGLAVIKTL
ncbi:MAG: fluoride efflux transporter CrcB [Hyphomicrobiaceae bacterium]